MILDSKNTTIAYRCPACGKNILSIVGIFSLSGDMIKLKCDCGGSELTITRTKDKKMRITAPCLICPKPHNFLIGGEIFFGGGLFALPCPLSGMNICFIGEKDEVIGAVKESDEELAELMKEAGIEDFSALHSEQDEEIDEHEHLDDDEPVDSTDPYVDDMVRFLIEDLKDSGNISCRCKDPSSAEYRYEFREKGVRVYCEKCGAEALLPVVNSVTAEDALNCSHLELK